MVKLSGRRKLKCSVFHFRTKHAIFEHSSFGFDMGIWAHNPPPQIYSPPLGFTSGDQTKGSRGVYILEVNNVLWKNPGISRINPRIFGISGINRSEPLVGIRNFSRNFPQFYTLFANFCNFGAKAILNHGNIWYCNFYRSFKITICGLKSTICAFNIHFFIKI